MWLLLPFTPGQMAIRNSAQLSSYKRAKITPRFLADQPSAVIKVSPDTISELSPDTISEVSPDAISEVPPDGISKGSPDAISKGSPDPSVR